MLMIGVDLLQDQMEIMIFEIFICVLLSSCWSIADNQQQGSFTTNFSKTATDDSCGGWGTRIVNMSQYFKIKHTCYLAVRNGELCCIEKPDCPPDLAPEIAVKPYHLYAIKKLSLGCVKPKDRKKKKNLDKKRSKSLSVIRKSRRKKMENKVCWGIFAIGTISCYVNFFVYFTITCLFIRNIKKENDFAVYCDNLTVYLCLIITHELLVIVFKNILSL